MSGELYISYLGSESLHFVDRVPVGRLRPVTLPSAPSRPEVLGQ